MIIGPAIGQEKAKAENVIVWDLWSDQNYQKIPELKQLHENSGVVIKESKIHSFLYDIFTQVLHRKHGKF